jgi:uncharacterized protein (TIGR01777 family)
MPVFEWRSTVPFSADEVYAWHARPGAFERLSPPWQHLRVVERIGGIDSGGTLVFEYRSGPVRGRWVAVHGDATPGRRFTDRQVHGPFEEWEHTHSFIPQGPDQSIIEDHVEYRLPLGAVSDVLGGMPAEHALERVFRFRHERTQADLERHATYAAKPRLRVAVTGATGLIGRQLVAFLESGGHTVARIVRGLPERESDVMWNPATGKLAAASLDEFDAIVHLAGANTGRRWSGAHKRRIMDSRRQGTALLASTLASMKRPPRVLLSASAVGYYGGDHGAEVLTEESAAGRDFLADVCAQWEAPLAPARDAGIRALPMRFGVVLSPAGGALARMLPAFRAGAGGPIGPGAQWLSWVAPDDLLGAVLDLLYDETVTGAVNVTSPLPVSNHEFVKTLGRVLRRPAVVPLPAAAIKAMFGEMGEVMLLGGQRVVPARLDELGFAFRYPDLESALRLELGHLG